MGVTGDRDGTQNPEDQDRDVDEKEALEDAQQEQKNQGQQDTREYN